MPFYGEIAEGKKTFEFRINDRDYKVGDTLHMKEYDPEKQEETGRQMWCDVTYVLPGGNFGLPEGYCVMGIITNKQVDYIRDFDKLSNEVLPRYEDKLSYKRGGNIAERMTHVLNEFESAASNSIYRAKDFIDDVKTQFKALELVVEGISSDSYNHTQKRVIANHVINLLRDMVQRINQTNFDYQYGIYERYDFFRSQTPERELYRKYKEMKEELERYKKSPVEDSIFKQPDEIPF